MFYEACEEAQELRIEDVHQPQRDRLHQGGPETLIHLLMERLILLQTVHA